MGIQFESEFDDGWLLSTHLCGRVARAWLSDNCIAVLTRKAKQQAKSDTNAGFSWVARLLAICLPHRRAAYQRMLAHRSQEILPGLIEKHIANVVTSESFFRTRTWRELRQVIVRRDGRVCQSPGCGRRIESDVDLHIDHIKPRSIFPEHSLDPWNLAVLCRECNFKKGKKHQPEGQHQLQWNLPHEPTRPDACTDSGPGFMQPEALHCLVTSEQKAEILKRGRYHYENNFKGVGEWEDRMVTEFGQAVMTVLSSIWRALHDADSEHPRGDKM